MYWLAALQIVPSDLYEAARMDGAGRWALHRYLTVPIILPFAAIILILSVAGALHVFALVQTMTGGGLLLLQRGDGGLHLSHRLRWYGRGATSGLRLGGGGMVWCLRFEV